MSLTSGICTALTSMIRGNWTLTTFSHWLPAQTWNVTADRRRVVKMTVQKKAALRKAATVIADEARLIASHIARKYPTGKISESIRVSVSEANSTATISAGGPEAPAAAMFEKPRARHPLFGDEKHWYYQPYRPFLEEAAEAKADEAMKVFADEMIDQMLKDSGL